jgi:hypothetical protein
VNWEEFHFFKQPDGLSKNDSLEMRACLDYERALECKPLIELVCGLDRQQREYMLNQALRYTRFVPVDAEPIPSVETEGSERVEGVHSPVFQSSKSMVSFPPIPAVCIAASWFPKNWLCAARSERQRVIGQIQALYPRKSIPMFDFPMDADTTKNLRRGVRADGHTTLHVIAIDRNQTKSALVESFEAWIQEQNDITGTLSKRGKSNVLAKLTDLGCFRLSRLDPVSRETTMEDAGFHRSTAKLSAAKRRAERRLTSLDYI